jgi:crossover junction endodeoxyribonuclease RuvC
MALFVVGLDLSLAASGVATPGGTFCLKPRTKGMERLLEIRRSVDAFVWDFGRPADLVVVEGYAYAAHQMAHQLGEVGGVIKLYLHEHGFRVAVVPPAKLRKYATGAGNAAKEAALATAVKRSGIEFRTHHEAEAWWLRMMGQDAMGEPLLEMPVANREALKGVEWPRRVAA